MARVLVIDDQQEIREVLKTILEENGHDVVMAADGGEGLKRYAEGPLDLVITDLHMRGMNGVETIREFRNRSAELKIIAMSGADTYMVETNLQSSVINGADRTLMKPFRMQEILAAVDDLLGAHTTVP